jgi:hypothetical protein
VAGRCLRVLKLPFTANGGSVAGSCLIGSVAGRCLIVLKLPFTAGRGRERAAAAEGLPERAAGALQRHPGAPPPARTRCAGIYAEPLPYT